MPDFEMPEMRQVIFPVQAWPALEQFLAVVGFGLAMIPADQLEGDLPTYVLVPLAEIQRAKDIAHREADATSGPATGMP